MINPVDLSTIPTERLEEELRLRNPKFVIDQPLDTGERATVSFIHLNEQFSISYHSTMLYPSKDTMKDLADWINAQLSRKATPEPIARKLIMGEVFNTNNIGDDTDMV